MLYKVTVAGHMWCVVCCVCGCVVCGVGGGGSEFSGVWGKRGEGGQAREGVQLPDSLMDEAVLQSVGPGLETPQSPPWWQQTEEAVCRVGGITCTEGFAGETGAVDVLEGGERDTNNLLSCSHCPLEGLAAERVAGAIPHSDAASQDALDGASVEGAHDGGRGSGSSEFAEEVETLLCFLGQCCSVVSPGEVLCDVYTQELGAAHSLHSHTIDIWLYFIFQGLFIASKKTRHNEANLLVSRLSVNIFKISTNNI